MFESNVKVWNFALISSTRHPIYNAFAGLGYVTSNSRTELKGSYTIAIPLRTIVFHDPFTIGNNVGGIKFNVGGKARLGQHFNAKLDYTLQGYNNVSLSLVFNN